MSASLTGLISASAKSLTNSKALTTTFKNLANTTKGNPFKGLGGFLKKNSGKLLRGNTQSVSSNQDLAYMQQVSGYSTTVLKQIKSIDEFEFYQEYSLSEERINNEYTLVSEVILSDENLALMQSGKPPLNKQQEAYQLKYIGDEFNNNLVLLKAEEYDEYLKQFGEANIKSVSDKVSEAYWKAYAKQIKK